MIARKIGAWPDRQGFNKDKGVHNMAVKKTAGATKVKARSTAKKATSLKKAAPKKAASIKKNAAAKKTTTATTPQAGSLTKPAGPRLIAPQRVPP